nr:ROK family protein [Tepidisphaeraceae bacterium]
GPAQAIGLAGPGIAAPDGRSIWWMQGRLDQIQGLNWTEFLSRPIRVSVLNDAQAALMGESWIGAAAGCKNVMLLTLGTGVGGALMVDGRLLRGHLGRAGHLGHICLNSDGNPDITGTPGSLENAIGNCTIEQRTNGRFKSTHDLIAASAAGDADATTAWRRSVRALTCGVASLINVADPEIVVIGGGIARAGAALFDPLRAELDRVEWRPHGKQARVVPAVLGEHAGAIGAARIAMVDQKIAPVPIFRPGGKG